MQLTENRSEEICLLCRLVYLHDKELPWLLWFFDQVSDIILRQLEEEDESNLHLTRLQADFLRTQQQVEDREKSKNKSS